jgi:dTDP-glucose 4,6-dehydratase
LSSVDGSINNPVSYASNNCVSTASLFDTLQAYDIFCSAKVKVVNVSTDEVYGPDSSRVSLADESSPLQPSNPYSASKAHGALLAKAYHNTYGLNVSTTHACNTYGPRQSLDKMIPKTISRLSRGLMAEVYGNGRHTRNWLHVDDHCRALLTVARLGKAGERYNIGSQDTLTNVMLVRLIANFMEINSNVIEFVPDRFGHDDGYSMHNSKLTSLGWSRKIGYFDGLRSTVNWYLNNKHLWLNDSE